jgi:endonuclease YncB( thermonuclease family)
MFPLKRMSLAEATTTIPEFSLAGKTLQGKVVSCYDGDTMQCVLDTPFGFWRFSCRMAGYDTPEMKPPKTKVDRDVEKARALKSKHALMTKVCDSVPELSTTPTNVELDACVQKNRKVIQVICKEFDKYGRLLVEIPNDVGTVNDWMIQQGYGYAYDGGTKDTAFATR